MVGLVPANFFAVPYYGTQFFTYDMLKVREREREGERERGREGARWLLEGHSVPGSATNPPGTAVPR